MRPEFVDAVTTHAREGRVSHAFRTRVPFVLISLEAGTPGPTLFSRRRGFAAVRDIDHGGQRGAGRGAPWAREAFASHGLVIGEDERLLLLAQPRLMGMGFNPVSFWLALRGDNLIAVIAEVNNTFGDRHSYLVAKSGFAPILRSDRLKAEKVFHVSPFREIAGEYTFGFDISEERIGILITHEDGAERLHATLFGRRRPMTNGALLSAGLRLPLGGLRTGALIYWQALRLKAKGARYRPRPLPPKEELT
ncbi:DUF1365 domain-containing protein [Pseudoroseicyclus sp. CXY001]|uniref:DUF1365 domain-containing protein n=1 Tax=Pseudoroseicyclus sp. CXY001 TaxID=3242492 RepID=UPI00358DCB99